MSDNYDGPQMAQKIMRQQVEIDRLREEVRGLNANAYNLTERGDKYLRELAEARALCAEQAEDEGLWFVAETAAEAYLQAALRRLHAVVEGER
jgi:DNA-binding PadR family transcriptional regulator